MIPVGLVRVTNLPATPPHSVPDTHNNARALGTRTLSSLTTASTTWHIGVAASQPLHGPGCHSWHHYVNLPQPSISVLVIPEGELNIVSPPLLKNKFLKVLYLQSTSLSPSLTCAAVPCCPPSPHLHVVHLPTHLCHLICRSHAHPTILSFACHPPTLLCHHATTTLFAHHPPTNPGHTAVRVRAHLRPAMSIFIRPLSGPSGRTHLHPTHVVWSIWPDPSSSDPHHPVRPAGPTGPCRPLSYSLHELSYILFP